MDFPRYPLLRLPVSARVSHALMGVMIEPLRMDDQTKGGEAQAKCALDANR
jgi:hypothetical protein